MEVIVAGNSGFCFGVKRAVEMVYAVSDDSNVYTYGPIIHNEEVINDLAKKGVEIIESIEEASVKEKGTIVIRAHGVPESTRCELEKLGHKVIDATCPFVLKIHNIVKKAVSNNEFVVIIGDKNHPEVKGIMGSAGNDCIVVEDEEGILDFINNNKNSKKKLCVVSQTTFNYNKFKYLVEILSKNSYDNVGVLNTICNATEERQKEAEELAVKVDAMIVIGSRNSSNTQKLYDICRKVCKNTFLIQNADDMDYALLCGMSRVGITAGASTPNRIIEEVQKRCQI